MGQTAQAQVGFLELSQNDVECEMAAAGCDRGANLQPLPAGSRPSGILRCQAAFAIDIGTFKLLQQREMVSDA